MIICDFWRKIFRLDSSILNLSRWVRKCPAFFLLLLRVQQCRYFFSFIRRRIYSSHLVNIEVSFSQFLSITWMDFHFLTNANQPFPQWFRFSHSSSRTKREKYNKRTTGISCFLWMDGINEKSQIPSESGPYIEQTTGGFCVMIWLVLDYFFLLLLLSILWIFFAFFCRNIFGMPFCTAKLVTTDIKSCGIWIFLGLSQRT